MFAAAAQTTEVAAIGVKLARVPAMVHARGVLHRDINASNVLIDANGGVTLLDFECPDVPTMRVLVLVVMEAGSLVALGRRDEAAARLTTLDDHRAIQATLRPPPDGHLHRFFPFG